MTLHLLQAVKVAVRQALDCMPQREKVCSIGVSGQQHGMVVLDESGNVRGWKGGWVGG